LFVRAAGACGVAAGSRRRGRWAADQGAAAWAAARCVSLRS